MQYTIETLNQEIKKLKDGCDYLLMHMKEQPYNEEVQRKGEEAFEMMTEALASLILARSIAIARLNRC